MKYHPVLSRYRFAPMTSLASACVAFLLLGTAAVLNAAEKTWTGGSSNNWTATGNWLGGEVPGINDVAVLTGNPSRSLLGPGASGVLDIQAIWMRDTAVNHNVQPISSSTSSINTSLYLSGALVEINGEEVVLLIGNTSDATLTLSDRTGDNVPLPIRLKGSGVIYADSKISIASAGIHDEGGAYSITKKGKAELVLNNANTFSGGFILDGGLVTSQNSSVVTNGTITRSPFGTGTLTLRSGTLSAQTANARGYSNAVVLDGYVTLGMESGGVGNISFESNAGKSTTIASDSTLEVVNRVIWNQAINGDSHSLTKSGNGTLIFNGNNGYSGDTIVAAGQLMVNGNLLMSEVEVRSGARLGGTGALYQTVTVKAGGKLAPGQFDEVGQGELNTRGQLDLYGNLVLEEGSYLEFRIDSASSYDSLYVQGDVWMEGAELRLVLGYTPEAGDTYVLVVNDGFSLLEGMRYDGVTLGNGDVFFAEGQYFKIFYDYNGSNLAVVAIPEPACFTVVAGGIGMLALRYRRRSRFGA